MAKVNRKERGQFIATVKKMVAMYGVTEAARRLGRSHGNISKIQSGKISPDVNSITIDDLGLRRGTGKMCRRCNRKPLLFTSSGLCIECEMFELERVGLISIDAVPQLEEVHS